MRIQKLSLAVLIVAGCALAGSARGDGYLTSVGSGDEKIPVVVVRGTPYEMGKRLGELTKADAVEFTHTALERIQASDPKRFSNEALDATWKAIAPHTDPRFKEELRGLSEGTGLSIGELQRAHALPVIAD